MRCDGTRFTCLSRQTSVEVGNRIMNPYTPNLRTSLAQRAMLFRLLANTGFSFERCKLKAKQFMHMQKQHRPPLAF